MKFELTKQEKNAIKCLKNLAKRWPKTLWLYSASGTLCIMMTNEKGEQALDKRGYVDQEYLIDDINIPNDGGDW